MRATLTERRFSDPAWIFEPKLDGQRCLAARDGDRVVLWSRTRRELGATYPEVVSALLVQPVDQFLLDGEVVALDGDRPSFSRLQQRMGIRDPAEARRREVPVTFVAFDLLRLAALDLRREPLRARRAVLTDAFAFGGALALNAAVEGEGEVLYDLLCAKGWEGVMAKRADAPYVSRRSGDWLKMKCRSRQEFVVGGFTDPSGSRTGFGALLLGVVDPDGDLRFVGKVGTGFRDADLEGLRARLDRGGRPDPPFAGPRPPSAGVHWVEPELVVEVRFAEWTDSGHLRHPSFLGVRDDVDPATVRREQPGA